MEEDAISLHVMLLLLPPQINMLFPYMLLLFPHQIKEIAQHHIHCTILLFVPPAILERSPHIVLLESPAIKFPITCNLAVGSVVPIPTLPAGVIAKSIAHNASQI